MLNILVIYLVGVLISFITLVILEIFNGLFRRSEKEILGYIKLALYFSLGSWLIIILTTVEILNKILKRYR